MVEMTVCDILKLGHKSFVEFSPCSLLDHFLWGSQLPSCENTQVTLRRGPPTWRGIEASCNNQHQLAGCVSGLP